MHDRCSAAGRRTPIPGRSGAVVCRALTVRLRSAWSLVVLVALGIAAAAPAAPAKSGWIVFTATAPGVAVNQLFRIRPSGTGLRQITRGKLPSIAPAFSPDGRRIAFARGGAGIFAMSLDGTGLRRLTGNGRDSLPARSPDGKQIA